MQILLGGADNKEIVKPVELHRLASSLEAVSQESVVPDEDSKHLAINSPVYRQFRRHLYGEDTPTNPSDELAVKILNRTISDALGGKRGAIHEHHLSAPGSPPRAMVLQESTQPKDFFVFLRGNPLARGEPVQPKFLSALSISGDQGTDQPYRDAKRRLGLAQSIVARTWNRCGTRCLPFRVN